MNKNNLILVAVGILVLLGGFFLIQAFTAKPPSETDNENTTPTPSPTSRITQITATVTPTTSASVTPTVTASTTPTVTTTPGSDDFTNGLDTSWVAGGETQVVSGRTYFIDSSNPKVLKRGSSTNDTSAETVFTSDTGDIASFNNVGSSIVIALKRNAATGETELVRYYPSTSRKALLFKYNSSKYEIVQFSIQRDGTSEFYIGFNGVNSAYQPMVMYVKSYATVWQKTVEGSAKTDKLVNMGITTDKKTVKVKARTSAGQEKTYNVAVE
jgi:hypothetical protein